MWPIVGTCVGLFFALGACVSTIERAFVLVRAQQSQRDLTRRRAGEEPRTFRASSFAPGQIQSKVLQPGAPIELEGFLEAALNKAGLASRADEARQWCEEQGAVIMGEVIEESDTLAEFLGLDQQKAALLMQSLVDVQEAEQALRKKVEQDTKAALAETAARFLRGSASQAEAIKAFEMGLKVSEASRRTTALMAGTTIFAGMGLTRPARAELESVDPSKGTVIYDANGQPMFKDNATGETFPIQGMTMEESPLSQVTAAAQDFIIDTIVPWAVGLGIGFGVGGLFGIGPFAKKDGETK